MLTEAGEILTPSQLSDSLVWIDVELFLEPRKIPIIGSRTNNKLNTVKDLEIWYHWWYISVTDKQSYKELLRIAY